MTKNELEELLVAREADVQDLAGQAAKLKDERDQISQSLDRLINDYERLRGRAAELLDRATRAERRVVKLLDQIDLLVNADAPK